MESYYGAVFSFTLTFFLIHEKTRDILFTRPSIFTTLIEGLWKQLGRTNIAAISASHTHCSGFSQG